MKDKNGKILLLIDENYNKIELSKDKIYFLSHPCTNGGSERINREKEEVIYQLLLKELNSLKIFRPLMIIPQTMGYSKAMNLCYNLLDNSDCVIFSPRWQLSKGCKLEHKYCIKNKIPRLYLIEENISKIT